MAVKVLAKLLIVSAIVQLCSGSAIPMWEFLSRNEKMSHLYSTFAKLVSDYCKTSHDSRNSPVAECKRDLLAFASDKLHTMSDNNLDILDPYQRAANQLIWDTIMRGHPNVKLTTTKRPAGGTAQTAASSQSSSILILPTNNNQLNAGGYFYPKNPIFDDKSTHHDKYSMELDAAYGNEHNKHTNYQPTTNGELVYRDPTQNYLQQPAIIETSTNYLSGPLVIRVRPDGTPVDEDRLKPLPRDDDRDSLLLSGRFVRRQKHFQNQDQQIRRLRRQFRNSNSYRPSIRRH